MKNHHHQRYLHGAVFILLLLLSGCGEQGPTLRNRLTVAELPAGIGRGFPVADVHGVDNDRAGLTPTAPAPDFNMIWDNGDYLALSDLHGRPVLLNFWATWCGPCRQEMPEIVAAADRDEALVVLAINVQEELAQLQPFAEEFQLALPVVRDSDATLRQLYAVSGMPTTVFIDRDGKIAKVWTGALTAQTLQEQLALIE